MARLAIFIMVLFAGLILVATNHDQTPVAEASSWECQWTVINAPVTGGYISGRGCRQFPDPYCCPWQVWADTYLSATVPPTWIYTRVIGYDICAGASGWSLRMWTEHYDGPSITYGTSGIANGTYQNCSQGHSYRVEGWHEKLTGSTWEGYSGNVYW